MTPLHGNKMAREPPLIPMKPVMPLEMASEEQHEREQLEGFMMMYELIRPICRASLAQETL